jgi:tetratricopeptide (TPR) repeat protein
MPNEPSSSAGAPSPVTGTAPQPPAEIPSNVQNLPWWLGIIVVLALTFAVYLPTLRYQFVHDDGGQIVDNPAVHSWEEVPAYFTTHVWEGVDPEELGNYYRPLFLLWLRINDAVFGKQPWGWHLTTILAHLLTTFLVFLLAWRLGLSREVAALAALIFGLHPAHIEAVDWISGVTEPLLGIFLVGSFLCYLPSRSTGGRALRWKVASLALFTLAILEKETAVILPGFLLVYEWIYGEEWGRRIEIQGVIRWLAGAIRQTWAFFLLVLLYIPARIHALKGFSHTITPLGARQLLYTWPELIWFWIRHLLWPVGLSTFYDLPAVVHPTLRNFILPAVLDLGVGIALVAWARKTRATAFFATWLIVPFIPLLNIQVFAADDFAHDRYLYLPSVGLAVLAAVVLQKVCVGQPRYGGAPVSLLVAVLCLASALGYGTMAEGHYFKDNDVFYSHNIARAPHNRFVELDYAVVLGEKGQYAPALERLTDVENRYPNFWPASYNLAYTYYRMGRLPEAEKYFLEAIRLKPYKPDAFFYLGMARFKMGRTADAIPAVRQAIAIRPTGYAYHFALGIMLKTQGDLYGAFGEFETEHNLYPDEQAAAEQIAELQKEFQKIRP